MYSRIVRLAALGVTTASIALGTAVVPAAAADRALPAHRVDAAVSGSVFSITDRLARQLATTTALPASTAAVDLADLRTTAALTTSIRQADRAVLAAKGLPVDAAGVLQVRLAHPDMLAALAKGVTPLVAAAPTDDVRTAVTAYEPDGSVVTLDPMRLPQRPVFVVDVDTSAALELGRAVIRETLDRHGITGATPSRASVNAGYWATQVRAVRLSDDEEPWIKGSAEIFGIAGGFGLDSKVKVDTVTMPYLDHDGTTYYPNQLIVHFSAYKYNLADFVMMEDDGDTNYLQLALALANALLTIVDGGVYIPLVSAILNALPTSWWTDDPDYVDSWYTMTTASGGRFNGARANGWMDLAPYWVQPL